MKPRDGSEPVPNWQMMRPDPRLRAHVLCYYLELPQPGAARPAARAAAEELMIPDGHSEIVFTIDSEFERWAIGEPDRREVMSRSYVIGGRSRSVITRDLGRVAVAGVKLDPRALRWLIGAPLSDFRESTLGLRELQRAALLELEDAVAHASREAAAAVAVARVLDRFLLRALGGMPGADRPIDDLIAQIRASRGALSIMDWVERHALDSRQVERQFSTAMGMTPKRYARVVRFKHSYHCLLEGGARPYGAHLDGFYDQSHFNKEFRTFIGAPPTARLGATLRQGTAISEHLLAGELSIGDAGSRP